MSIERETRKVCQDILKSYPSMSNAEVVGLAVKNRDFRMRLLSMTGSDAEYYMTLLVEHATKITRSKKANEKNS